LEKGGDAQIASYIWKFKKLINNTTKKTTPSPSLKKGGDA